MKTGNLGMTTWGIAALRDGGLFVRSTAAIIIIAFVGLVTSPAVAATRAEMERQERTAVPEQGESAKLNAALRATKEELRKLAGKPDVLDRVASKEERKAAREALKDLREQLRELDKVARADFREIEKHLKANKLSDVILQRHHEAVAKYEAEAEALLNDLAGIETLDDAKATERAAKAFERLDKQQLERSHKPFDPNKMPFGRPDNKVREPATTPEEFAALGFEQQPEFMAASVALTSGLGFGADDPANLIYLAATPDAQITPAIEQLAEELENNPVKIYNWVRNNIEFLPTYGSIQGSQLTLDNRKGNAFDTASFTVALLRAAGIPARYVYGTVEMSADKVMNWVGGVTDPMAAGNLMGQGGIPHTALALGGEIKAFRLEHVWVEAWVDFHPSRGAINREGDSWVPMDASFKQYAYTDGVDVAQEVPFDVDGFAQDVLSSAVVNEAEGWVQGIDQTLIQQRMEEYQAQVEAFIDAQDPDTTVGDVSGAKTIIEENQPILPGSIFGKLNAIGARYGELPDAQRFKFQYVLQDRYGSELARFQPATVDVAGKRVALSFRPANQADADLIASYLPEVSEGDELDPSDLPESLPGYLINLTAEFSVDGETVQVGPTVTMGTELNGVQGYYFPGEGWQLQSNNVTAGEYQTIGLDLAGVAPRQLESLRTDLESVRTKLDNNETAGLTRHSLTGNLLQTGVLGYFALNDAQDQIAAQASGVVTYRLPSYGTFSTGIQTDYWYGMPRDVRFPGVVMDISSMYTQVVDKGNAKANTVNFMRTVGPRGSALEHLVPEQLLSTEENRANGISAVKAIAIAQSEGQRVYNVNATNLSAALASVNADSEIETEIKNAVNAGKEVSIHQNPISYYGWQGHGYIIIDPETGSGAYKISGGANGGELFTVWDGLQAYFSLLIGSQAKLEYVKPLLKGLVRFVAKALPFITIPLTVLSIFDSCHATDAALISALYVAFSVAIIFMFASPVMPMLGVFMSVLAATLLHTLTMHLVANQC